MEQYITEYFSTTCREIKYQQTFENDTVPDLGNANFERSDSVNMNNDEIYEIDINHDKDCDKMSTD